MIEAAKSPRLDKLAQRTARPSRFAEERRHRDVRLPLGTAAVPNNSAAGSIAHIEKPQNWSCSKSSRCCATEDHEPNPIQLLGFSTIHAFYGRGL